MSAGFATLPDDGGRLRVVVVGAGPMGRTWLRTIAANDDVELAGIADLAVHVADQAADDAGHPGLPTGPDAVELARRTNTHAIINVTIPAAHHPVTTAALLAGYPVLGEKPVASTVAEGLSLAACAELTGQLFMVSQSRRYFRNLFLAKRQAQALGRIGALSVEFFKAPRFGGFREVMESPLLLDMAIHQFDAARFLLDADPVSVICEEYNPAWSWFAGNAAASAVFEFEGGARFAFTGSWASPGFETSWNGSWRISGERGTVLWDGEHEPTADVPDSGASPAHGDGTAGVGSAVVGPSVAGDPDSAPGSGSLPALSSVPDPGTETAGSLREFVAALRTGAEPMGRVHSNVVSLAMVEAAMRSARLGRRVAIDEVLGESYESALAAETHEDLLRVLKSWPSVRDGLGASRRG
ncbi:Gfo/Idh/MocA family oxidoreductase [Sinomonas sp. ASV322]|uniref:Gfo/Idh/MocA family protein n=1 Tax=Sinomonas sp. ASV322 TaxID=3041920 RepID=UPI0027DDD5D2|nr:Gfo/Idh/MocA family oxidoreductase [Sinomonas sp. ASV322]MDQ4504278.1 Gfo/Idh/MocA family oxidoreductase [Sinomonas sp. ASV322]